MNHLASLLSPDRDDPLGQIVFGLISCLYLVAVLAAVVARRGHLRESKETEPLVGRHADYDARLVKLPDRLAEAAPGLLIMVGLLGTFVGIAVAIGEAQALVATRGSGAEVAQRLGGMLQSIGVKFRSSAWGLMGFLTLKPIIHLLVVEHRHWAATSLEARARSAAREAMLAEEAKRAEALAAEAALAQGRLAEVERRRLEELERWQKRDKLFAEMAASVKPLEKWSQILDALGQTSADISKSAKAMGVAAGSLTRTMNDVASVVKGAVADSGRQVQAAMEETARATQSAVDRSSKASMEASASLERVTGDLKSELASALEANRKSLSDAIGGASAVTAKAVTDSASAVKAAVASLSNLGTDIRTELAASVKRSEDSMTGAMDKLARQSKEIVEDLRAANQKSMKQLVETQERGSGAVKGALGEIQSALAAMNQTSVEIEEITVKLGATFTESAVTNHHLRGAVETLNVEMKKVAGDLERSSKNLAITMKAVLGGARPVSPVVLSGGERREE